MEQKIKNSVDVKVSWEKVENKKLIYYVHARNNFLHDNIIKQIVRKMLENKKKNNVFKT